MRLTMTLLTRDEFIRYRDKFATDSMLTRLADCERESAIRLRDARVLRKKLKACKTKHERERYEPDYDVKMAEWAYFESLIGTIINDARYIAHMAKQAKL
jgi:hypothetical protein